MIWLSSGPPHLIDPPVNIFYQSLFANVGI